MIDDKNGRASSYQSQEEIEKLLAEDIERLTPEEHSALRRMLEGDTDEIARVAEQQYVREPVSMKQFVLDPYYLGETCKAIYPRLLVDLEEVFRGDYNEIIFTGAIGVGKCVDGDTEVVDVTTGKRRLVKDLSSLRVQSFSAEGESRVSEATAFPSGEKACLELVLASGQSLVLSEDHPVLTGRGWVEAADLTLSDLVATPGVSPIPGQPPTLTRKTIPVGDPCWAKLVGSAPDLLWAPIQSLQSIGVRSVYDLSVPGDRNFVANGIVIHNTFSSSIGLCRVLYELSCLREPQRAYGLSKDSPIVLAGFSVNEELAKEVVLKNVIGKIGDSPYFREHFKFKATQKNIRFPNNVIMVARATTQRGVLGQNVLAGLIDECLHSDSQILLSDGTTCRVADLLDKEGIFVVTFDSRLQVAKTAPLHVKRSTDQMCWALELDTGQKLKASWNHPVALRRDGVLGFYLVRDIMPGDEVVVFREAPFQRDSGGHFKGAYRKTSYGGNTSENVEGPQRQTDAHRGVQRGFAAAQSVEKRGVQAFRGIQAQDVRGECLDSAERELSVPFVCGSREGREEEERSDGVTESVGIAGCGVVGGEPVGDFISVRGGARAISVGRKETYHYTGFSGVSGEQTSSVSGGEAQGLHIQRKGKGEALGYEGLLKGAGLGLRAMGRQISVGRVVSKRHLGVCPTYDVHVPQYQTLIADGALVHNTNFMPTRRGRVGSDRFGMVNMAKMIYDSLTRRIKSRYGRRGKLFMPSSKATMDSFISDRIQAAKTDPTIFVRDYSLWDVRPDDYSDKTFFVLCGNEQTSSKLLTDAEAVVLKEDRPERTVLVEVPEDFRAEFESDLDGSIRDVAGVATVSISPFIQVAEKIRDMSDPDRQHPFSTEIYDPSKGGKFSWSDWVKPVSVRNDVTRQLEEMLVPIHHPSVPRHLHIDPSLNNCAAGLCMSCVPELVNVERIAKDRTRSIETAPFYFVDLILKIVPPIGGEIEFALYRQLIYELREYGFPITTVTMDSYQSVDGLQQLSRKGYQTDTISMDKSWDPYQNLKQALYEGRISCYYYFELFQELRGLEADWFQRKVVKPENGTKDVADALAGVCYSLLHHQRPEAMPMTTSLMQNEDPRYEAWMVEQQQAAHAGYAEAICNAEAVPGDFVSSFPLLLGKG